MTTTAHIKDDQDGHDDNKASLEYESGPRSSFRRRLIIEGELIFE